MDLADRIRQQRKFLKLTQTELAEKAGLKQQTVQQLETRKVLSTGRIVELAEALGVRPEWLAEGVGPMQGNEFTEEERKLVEIYRALDPAKRPIAEMTLYAMLPPAAVPAYQAHHANQTRRVLSPPPPPITQ